MQKAIEIRKTLFGINNLENAEIQMNLGFLLKKQMLYEQSLKEMLAAN